MNRIEITITYRQTQEDFTKLEELYPTGYYNAHEGTQWFRLDIDSPNGIVKLMWFKEQ